MIAAGGIRRRARTKLTCRMPARVTFTDAGVAFDADGALAPAAQLVAKLRLAIDAGAIPEGATLPSIRTGAGELGVHSNTLRKVYAALEAQGYATTRHGSGTVAHVRDAAGAEAVREIADGGARERARGRRGCPSSSRSRSWPAAARRGPPRPARARPPGRRRPRHGDARRDRAARSQGRPCCRPTSRAASHVGLVTSDEALVSRAPGARPSGAACACASRGPTTARRSATSCGAASS